MGAEGRLVGGKVGAQPMRRRRRSFITAAVAGDVVRDWLARLVADAEQPPKTSEAAPCLIKLGQLSLYGCW